MASQLSKEAQLPWQHKRLTNFVSGFLLFYFLFLLVYRSYIKGSYWRRCWVVEPTSLLSVCALQVGSAPMRCGGRATRA